MNSDVVTTSTSRHEELGNNGRSRAQASPRRLVAAVVLLVVVAATAWMVKVMLFPSVKEAYFALNERSLQQAGSRLVVVRPTRFARSHFHGVVSTTVRVFRKPVPRFMGRNVSLRELMAVAYGRNADRVLVPDNAPSTHFDFLVTVPRSPQEQLQQAIRKQLGYIARPEPHETAVLALKVQDANLAGLVISEADKKPGVEFRDGKLCFTHVPLRAFSSGLEQALGTPVVDKTGLTNLYDFSVAWSVETQRLLQNRDTAHGMIDKVLSDLGLGLQPDTVSVEMLVVKRAESLSATK